MEESKKFDVNKLKPAEVIKQLDAFTNLTPRAQISWWWKTVYKPFIVGIVPSLLASAIIGALMQMSGKYSLWEESLMIVLVFISSRISNACNILLRIEKKLNETEIKTSEENKLEPSVKIPESTAD